MATTTTTTHDFRSDRRSGPEDRRQFHPPTGGHAPVVHQHTLERAPVTSDGIRVSWGGIWGGVLTAVGTLLLLAALGVAIGITAVDPQAPNAGTIGTAAGIWAAVSLLIALFLGGMVSTRTGATFDGATGFWEGFLVWVVSLLLMGYLATTGISNLAGGAFSMMGGASQVMGSMMQGAGPQAAPGAPGAGGTTDPAQAVDQLKSRVQDPATRGQLQQRAAEAQPTVAKGAWITFGALVLSLMAALLGAMAGRRRPPENY